MRGSPPSPPGITKKNKIFWFSKRTHFIELFYFRFVTFENIPDCMFLSPKSAYKKSWWSQRINLVPSPTASCYWKWYPTVSEWCLRSCLCLMTYSPFRIIDNHSAFFSCSSRNNVPLNTAYTAYVSTGKTSPNNTPCCKWDNYRDHSSVSCIITYFFICDFFKIDVLSSSSFASSAMHENETLVPWSTGKRAHLNAI